MILQNLNTFTINLTLTDSFKIPLFYIIQKEYVSDCVVSNTERTFISAHGSSNERR